MNKPTTKTLQNAFDNLSEINYLEADINYTNIHYLNGSKQTISYTLKRLEEVLQPSRQFIRIHRSFLVNSHHIKNKSPHEIHMKDGLRLPVARRRRV